MRIKIFADVNLLYRFEVKSRFKMRSISNVKLKKFAVCLHILLMLLLYATSRARLNTIAMLSKITS